MEIMFSGHRDRFANPADLQKIADKFPEAVWIHGGAKGFDSQVEAFAKEHGISTQIFRPDYKMYNGRRAPLERNKTMVARANAAVFLYDGRERGGTYHALKEARKTGMPILFLLQFSDKVSHT